MPIKTSNQKIEVKTCPMGERCPCAGDEPEYWHGAGGTRLQCPCGTSGPWSDNLDDALEGWNHILRFGEVSAIAIEARRRADDAICATLDREAYCWANVRISDLIISR